MTDSGGLAVAAVILYLWESAAWVPEGAEAFRVPLRGRWRLARESWSLARPPGRVVLGGLMPGESGIAVCEARHPRVGPDGVCVCRSGPVRATPLAWDALEPVRAEGRWLRAGAQDLLRVGTIRYARGLAAVLEAVRCAPERDRAALLEAEFDRLLDVDAVRDQVARYRRGAAVLRPLSWGLAALVAIALPAMIATRDSTGAAWTAIAALVVAAATVIVYGRRRLALGGRSGDGGTLAMALMPLAALRADDYLARDAFADRHVWAVARGAEAAPPWTRAEPADGDVDPTATDAAGEPASAACCEAAAWADRAWGAAMTRREAQQPERPLREALRRESPDAVAYCPRCHQQYARTGACADCVDVALLPLEPEHVAR